MTDENLAPEEMTPEDAIAHFTAQIDANPRSAEAYYNRGNAFYNLGDHEAAIADYDLAIRYDSRLAGAYAQRGYSHFALGNVNAAIRDFRQVTKQVDDDPVIFNNLGYLYMISGRASRAESVWREATLLDHAPDFAYAGHAVALKRMGKDRLAEDDYRIAVEMQPRWWDDLEAIALEFNWTEEMIGLAVDIIRDMVDEGEMR